MKRKKTCVATETIEHVQINKFKTKFSQPVIVYAYGLFFIKWQKQSTQFSEIDDPKSLCYMYITFSFKKN